MAPKVTDSSVWRRLCDINSIATELCSFEDGIITWNLEGNGQFSIKSAYNEVREKRYITFTAKHNWNKHQHMQIKVFMWKLLNSYLPVTDNLQGFHVVINPSRCPLCKNHRDYTNHLFFGCTL
ncbi:unnamed protein product [Cuscuta epithymum]|uniref:Reverse transcriptase zinc-binding domain-containing protein n=1 Tax=Cuscuta epithymum TaxID=186058 RepID=A0AAV0F4K3_9ASTE|nr:unnamed protein product [Cuscuta epithymum]